MKTILIVEDEKMIRQGIQAMIIRSPVHFDEIILCKNGEEAYEIIKNQKIDIMITDIRMPKKDGLTLVREIQSLPHIPKIIVISGYDDFSYAVEFMRFGAKEYILKPVDREKLKQILIKLDIEIELEKIQKNDISKMRYQQFNYMLLKSNIKNEEIVVYENQFKEYFLQGEYLVCCTNYKPQIEFYSDDIIFLDDINGHSIFVFKSAKKEEILKNILKGYFVGVSRVHSSLVELREAYQEALYAWKQAFVTDNVIIEYSKPAGIKEMISSDMIDQYVQMVGTDKINEAIKFLGQLFYKTKKEVIDPDHFEEAINTMVERICVNYKNILSFKDEGVFELKSLYEYENASSYYSEISKWIEVINEKLVNEFDGYKNKQKIQKAIIYIQENYNKDINMAVVSNYISMNYSLFSCLFKQTTGMNFVCYLKTIRINEAKKLLEKTDKKINEISFMIGYDNEKHFMKLFKNKCGVSPSEYRKNVQVGKLSV